MDSFGDLQSLRHALRTAQGYTKEMNKQWIVIRGSDETRLLSEYKRLSQNN